MKNKIVVLKILVSLIILIISNNRGYTQSQISSPYTRYGIGYITQRGFGQNQAMGGLAYGLRSSNHINCSNPASYSSFDTLSFIFEAGLYYRSTFSETVESSQTNNDMNYNYLSIGFPVTDWWYSSFGLLPFSDVGYNIRTSDTSNTYGFGTIDNYYKGNGGIKQFYFGNSFLIKKHLSVGFNATYLFGFIEQESILSFEDNTVWSIENSNKVNISDFYFDFGLQYSNNYNDKFDYTFGLVFSNKSNISVTKNVLDLKLSPYYGSDTIVNLSGEADEIVLPTNFGIGFSIKGEKVLFGADYSTQNWSESTFLGESDNLENSNNFSVGFQYVPNKRSITNYFKRVNYRIGAHYSNTYLNIPTKDINSEMFGYEQLNDIGISLGFGLPIRYTNSAINIAVKVGQRGTTDFNLIKENYAIVSLNLSLHDIWFVKRKFD
ncbi:MAG: hypothetical protein HN704_08095 [Bacteroidetes bacterium]|jgi:hypothetical protein|nr:hypothetical protein [Bacteroidota bacterium]MBT6686490.1 hypothetical protein [Bacteroidota bacterium]MBT7143336.1 hypothetical protein [Bacteroidota bacterium]MBT7491552.1 hypothetical protein [Bacteroidota bacterium]